MFANAPKIGLTEHPRRLASVRALSASAPLFADDREGDVDDPFT